MHWYWFSNIQPHCARLVSISVTCVVQYGNIHLPIEDLVVFRREKIRLTEIVFFWDLYFNISPLPSRMNFMLKISIL
jgi:hypothetical protein